MFLLKVNSLPVYLGVFLDMRLDLGPYSKLVLTSKGEGGRYLAENCLLDSVTGLGLVAP
jgi:hypothetical protein